jgi:hypothetical protein
MTDLHLAAATNSRGPFEAAKHAPKGPGLTRRSDVRSAHHFDGHSPLAILLKHVFVNIRCVVQLKPHTERAEYRRF